MGGVAVAQHAVSFGMRWGSGSFTESIKNHVQLNLTIAFVSIRFLTRSLLQCVETLASLLLNGGQHWTVEARKGEQLDNVL